MIKVELTYNPYLGETGIKFNGQAPRINSLVEKYQGLILNDWIDKIPSIFCDEMNGYGFELDFSGTELDFRNLSEAFKRAGITQEQVPIFYKNELESRQVKVSRIEKLLTWLENNPNHGFDFSAFKEANSDLLDDLYVYKILQGDGIDTDSLKDKDIAVENISEVHELDSTSLSNVPILICISEHTLDKLQLNIQYLLKRSDVILNQVFFFIEDNCDKEMIIRTIFDLGITEPQIVSSLYDEKVQAYFEIYPITDYIMQTLAITRAMAEQLKIELDSHNIAVQVSEKKASIDKSDYRIQELKKLNDAFANRDNIELPSSFVTAQTELMNSINNWRSRMTVMTKETEAQFAAQEFENQFSKYYEKFWNAINVALVQEEEKVFSKYLTIYYSSSVDPGFRPGVASTSRVSSVSLPSIKDDLMAIREENHVLPKEGIIEQVFKPNGSNRFLEKVTRFYCKDWREFVIKIATEKSNGDIEARFNCIRRYSDDLAKVYQDRINSLLNTETGIKNSEVSQLSETEMQMQTDSDWLRTLIEQIQAIERG